MKLYTVVVHNLHIKQYRCCLKFRRGDNSTYTFTKRGVVYLVYLVSVTPTKLLIEFYETLHSCSAQPANVHEGCCLKFRRGDNSTYTFTKRGVVYLVSATSPKRLIGFL